MRATIIFLMGVLCLLTVPAVADDVPVLQAAMTGTVQNGAGIPVSGVEVSCWWFEAPTLEPPTFTRGGETRSGADGRFALMCPHPRQAPPWLPPAGMLLGFVVTRHPDYGITVTPWQRTDAGLYRGATQLSDVPPELMPPRAAPPILLPASARAAGTVRDPQGAQPPGWRLGYYCQLTSGCPNFPLSINRWLSLFSPH